MPKPLAPPHSNFHPQQESLPQAKTALKLFHDALGVFGVSLAVMLKGLPEVAAQGCADDSHRRIIAFRLRSLFMESNGRCLSGAAHA